jgi:hypothetical protein
MSSAPANGQRDICADSAEVIFPIILISGGEFVAQYALFLL